VPMSMKVGGNGWFLFGTVEYPANERMLYQIQETYEAGFVEVEYVKNHNFDYLFGLRYTF